MVEEIEEFLGTVITPELTAVYVDAVQVILDSGISMHIVQLEGLISQEGEIGRDQVVSEIDAYLKNLLESTLNQFGVFLNETFGLKHATAIIRSINTLDDFDDVETIEAICLSEESPEERLAALVELTSEFTVEDLLLHLDNVNPALLKRLLTTVHKVDDGFDTPTVQRTGKVVRIKSCTSQLKDPWLLAYVDAGGKINLPVASMAEAFRTYYEEKRVADPMLDRNVSELALQLMAFILASDVADADLLRVSEEVVEDTFLKLPLIIRVMEQVREILSAVTHEQA